VTNYQALIELLTSSGVEFIIVGGAAAVAHGSARLTEDLDIVYRRTPDNIKRLAGALGGLNPYLRGAPAGLPFKFDENTIRNGLNFTLTTELGWIDLLGEITGGGRYEELLPYSSQVNLFGQPAWLLGLKMLIQVKRAAGRPKDIEAIAELERILEKS